jgi:hypothetical protein
MAGASSSGGPGRFGLDKTKGLNDMCRRDARIRAEKEAAAQEEFSRRLGECSLEEQSSLAAQRHFALQVVLACLYVLAAGTHFFQEAKFGSGKHMLCRRCWIMNKDCICSKAKLIPSSHFQHKLIIYMSVHDDCICTIIFVFNYLFLFSQRVARHFKEYSRSSNTGALPQVCLDESRISVLVKGIPSHDSEVMQMCETALQIVVVFIPRMFGDHFAAARSRTRFFFFLAPVQSLFQSSCMLLLGSVMTRNYHTPVLFNHLYRNQTLQVRYFGFRLRLFSRCEHSFRIQHNCSRRYLDPSQKSCP